MIAAKNVCVVRFLDNPLLIFSDFATFDNHDVSFTSEPFQFKINNQHSLSNKLITADSRPMIVYNG